MIASNHVKYFRSGFQIEEPSGGVTIEWKFSVLIFSSQVEEKVQFLILVMREGQILQPAMTLQLILSSSEPQFRSEILANLSKYLNNY